MINDWRQTKGAGDFAIGTMQLPPSVKTGTDPAISNPLWAGRPDIRAAQATSAAHAGNTTDVSGVAVTIDCGGSSNWGFDHPPNKNEMSRRLALQLLHTAYDLNESTIPLWTGPVVEGIAQSVGTITLTFTVQTSVGGLSLRDVTAPTSVDDGRGGVGVMGNNCTLCCDGGGAPFEVTFDADPSGVGKNVSWIRLTRSDITIGPANTVVLHTATAAQASTDAQAATGLRYAWTDFVDCVLDNGNSGGIPAGPFRHFFLGEKRV
jgi:hypothetical protein